jgi:hypothetical protein
MARGLHFSSWLAGAEVRLTRPQASEIRIGGGVKSETVKSKTAGSSGRAVMWFLAAALAVGIAPAHGQTTVTQPRQGPPGSWRLIGTVQANFRADHDGIAVMGPYDNFRSVKFKVTGGGLNLDRLMITYGNGQPENIPVRYNIPAGGESRQISLSGGTRRIRRIDFWYKTQPGLNGRANVTVFGMK